MASSDAPQYEGFVYEEVATPRASKIFTKDNIKEYGYLHVAKQIRAKLAATSHVPACEIRLENVEYVAQIPLVKSQIETCVSVLKPPSFGQQLHTKHILRNINAIFKPGTMTLVLGPPGCGKTSLLKHIAGILHVKGKEEVLGKTTYNGCTADQVDLSTLVAYVQQNDNHFATLTVKETLDFAHKCLVGNVDPSDPLAANEEHAVDILMSILGLTECADTILGDEMTRGVSGGQKRRVTLGEMMTGRATTLLLDEFSNGLDASTTFDITKAVRTMAQVLNKTVVVAMLQPPPEVYSLFDNIMVLDKGNVIFNGPREGLPAYFRSIGYECPQRKDIADFLQEVTTPLGQRFAVGTNEQRPSTPEEFAACFQRSKLHQDMASDLAYSSTFAWNLPSTSKVALGYADCFNVLLSRAWKTSVRDMNFNISRLGEAIMLGVVVGTVFLSIGRDKTLEQEAKYVSVKFSLFFLAILTQALATLAGIEEIVKRRHVLYKQTAVHFFHVSLYAATETLMDMFWTIPQVLLFSLTMYFAVGLEATASAVLTFIVLLYLVSICYAQFFRCIAAVSVDGMLANVQAMFIFFLHIVFSGYILPETKIPSGWIWVYWTNPLAWALRALLQNEYLSEKVHYNTLVPLVLPNGTQAVARFGDNALLAYGVSTNKQYIWGAIVFMACFFLLMVVCTSAAYRWIRVRAPFSTLEQGENGQSRAETSAEMDVEAGGKSHDSGINSLPFEPVTLAFRNLKYTINVGSGKSRTTRDLLTDIHGCFEPGTLTALMGSTGAGKTTLLDVLAGRKTAGVIEGDLFVNGHALDRRTFNSVMGYCEQTDTHEGTSTVREAFYFSAALRLPSDTTDSMREAFVADILDVLELKSKADAQCMTLSQGERKRVTIGVELLSNPSILFLDEPTTGLDSRAATIVMECIKRIAESGRTVICTIHQPSTALFELFDKLVLLKSGGRLVYFGDLGSESASLLSYFSSFQGLPPITAGENPATYMLNCIGAGTTGAKIDVDFADAYTASPLGQRNEALVNRLIEQPNGNKLGREAKFSLSFGRQFALLFGRQWTAYWRTPSYNTSRMALMVLLPLIFVSCFYGTKITSSMDIISQMALIFMGCSFLCIALMTTAIPFVSASRGVYYREHLSAMYSPLAHCLSLALVEFIYCIVLSLVFFNCFYWLCGFSTTTEAWVWFWVSLAINLTLWSYLGHLLVYATSTLQMAVLTGSSLSGILFVFSGFLIDGNTLPKGWQWMYWATPMHYMLEVIITSQYNSQTRTVIDAISSMPIPINEFVKRFYNEAYSYDNIGRDMGLLAAIIIVMELVILFYMAKVNHTSR